MLLELMSYSTECVGFEEVFGSYILVFCLGKYDAYFKMTERLMSSVNILSADNFTYIIIL